MYTATRKGLQDTVLAVARGKMNDYVLNRQKHLDKLSTYVAWRSPVTDTVLSAFGKPTPQSYGDFNNQASRISNWTIEKWSTHLKRRNTNTWIPSAEYIPEAGEAYPPTQAQIDEVFGYSKYTVDELAQAASDWDNGLDWIFADPQTSTGTKTYGINWNISQLNITIQYLPVLKTHYQFRIDAGYTYLKESDRL